MLLWLLASVIMTPIVVFVLGPGCRPATARVEASGQVMDNTVLLGDGDAGGARRCSCTSATRCGRSASARPRSCVDGPPIRGNSSVQFWWLIVTTTLVLFLAGYGTVRLLADGSGGGQGPNPIAIPPAPAATRRSRSR